MFSLGVSLLGALLAYDTYIAFLTNIVWRGDFLGASAGLYDGLVSDVALSPIIRHLALIAGGWPLELAWIELLGPAPLLTALGMIALGKGLAWLAYGQRGRVRLLIGAAALAIVDGLCGHGRSTVILSGCAPDRGARRSDAAAGRGSG